MGTDVVKETEDANVSAALAVLAKEACKVYSPVSLTIVREDYTEGESFITRWYLDTIKSE